MVGTMVIWFICFALLGVMVAIGLSCAVSDTKLIHRAGYNSFEHRMERIMQPTKEASKYKYVYVTCNSDRWPCGAVLIVNPKFDAYKLNHDYVFRKYDPDRNVETAFQCGVFRYTTQPYGYGFNTNLYDCTCYGEVIGIRIGDRNQYF